MLLFGENIEGASKPREMLSIKLSISAVELLKTWKLGNAQREYRHITLEADAGFYLGLWTRH